MPSVPEFAHPADQSPSPAGGLRLRLSLKGQPVQSFRFDQDAIIVGRDPYCDIYVDNPGVSRQHLRIERAGAGEFRVRDLDSANGTFLNNQPVQIAALRDGDAIQLGKYTLNVEIEKERPDLAVPRRPVPASDGATVMLSPSEIRNMVSEAKAAVARPPDLKLVTAPATRPIAPPPAARRSGGTVWLIVAAIALLGAVVAIAIEWWRTH
jgi:predicted component of type VI protein secretion system